MDAAQGPLAKAGPEERRLLISANDRNPSIKVDPKSSEQIEVIQEVDDFTANSVPRSYYLKKPLAG